MEMNSRPIQQAEKDFFSMPSQGIFYNWIFGLKLMPLAVPVVAIVTKFDTFLQDAQQKIEERAEEEDQVIDDDEVERLATVQANVQFEQHYKKPLVDMKHPPKAVVTLSEGKVFLSFIGKMYNGNL